MEYDRAQLKRRVRQAMRGQRPRPMLITLLFVILVSIGTQIVNGILRAASGSNELTSLYARLVVEGQRDPLAAIQYVVMYFGPQRLAMALAVGFVLAAVITTLWSNFMRTGYCEFCLGMVRGEMPQTGALFNIFPQWGSVLFTKFLVVVFRTLWQLLLDAALLGVLFVAALLFGEMDVLFLLVAFVVSLASGATAMWITLRYTMVDFLIVDRGLTGMEAVRESKRMVRENGNTGRLFILELSFIGWYLVEFAIVLGAVLIGVLMFGPNLASAASTSEAVGALAAAMLGYAGLMIAAFFIITIFSLWLSPYMTGARALFYDWVRGGDITRPAAGFGGGDGGWGQSTDYTRSEGPSSGTGIGSGSQNGGNAPRAPKPPKDDPWN